LKTRALVTAALLIAVGVVLTLLWEIPPFSPFLTVGWMFGAPWLQFNPADIPTLLGSFALGPVFGGIIAIFRAGITNFAVGSGGYIGFIMDASSSVVLAVVAGAIYHFKRTRVGAVLALLGGTIAMTIVSVAMNFFWAYPAFGLPANLAFATALPFSLIKGVVNAVVVYLLYKPLSVILHGKREGRP